VVAVAAAVWSAGLVGISGAAWAWAAPAANSWGRAIGVPGLGALNKGGHAEVFQVSCGSAGNCAAGGFYHDRHGHGQGFVVSKRNGVWARAIEVPGLAALRKGTKARVLSVSCSLRRNCAAGGFYGDGAGHQQGFVVSEKNGVWGRAIEVPGLGALNAGGFAHVVSVSCGSPGSCAAGGFYADRPNHFQGFTVNEENGVWGQVVEVPGLEALNAGGFAQLVSVSCGSGSSCAAGGAYRDGHDHMQGFVVSEKNGVWGQAIEVPGLGALNTSGGAGVVQVSCGSAGNCAAGGFYAGANGGFVVSEKNGVWGQAIEVPGLAALAGPHSADVDSVSCSSAGNCAAGGGYQAGHAGDRGFVVSEKNGVWGQAIEVPGLQALGKYAGVVTVSCASPGNCAAGGGYRDQLRHWQGFVVSQKNGVWGLAIETPGLGALNTGGHAGVNSVSCASPGSCTAGGSYTDRNRFGRFHGFVT
jgi:hypothetical protein